MTARHIDSAAFQREVLQSQRPTLIDFYADWCGPCRAMAPVVDQLASDFQGRANVVKVNVDESPELASRYGVQSIPTFIVVRDGNAGQRLVGAQTRQALATAIAG
jgi:thioredoxin 1